MCTPDTSLGSAVQPPIRRQAPRFLLPEDPSPEELVQYWTLSARDQAEVRRCRGEANRRRFAVQLCTLRAYGRFVPEATPTPVTMTNHLARQLDLPWSCLATSLSAWPRRPRSSNGSEPISAGNPLMTRPGRA